MLFDVVDFLLLILRELLKLINLLNCTIYLEPVHFGDVFYNNLINVRNQHLIDHNNILVALLFFVLHLVVHLPNCLPIIDFKILVNFIMIAFLEFSKWIKVIQEIVVCLLKCLRVLSS